jgi:hypothetical protein
MIVIQLVKVQGYLVGRTVSDRWNLESIGMAPMRDDRNQTAVKRLRRILTAEYGAGAFAVKVVRAEFTRYAIGAERTELGRHANRLEVPFGVAPIPASWVRETDAVQPGRLLYAN